ncbi:hypothetical protein Y032_0043g778 [Ancylostoma ceylanicum]|uniref:Uncharacterized protein n=1 Tax=Ancylostoma ceylanicum TaxID=53326 RepID=A0A016UFD9_9BILA|nr:hypothetical protein Y032_0043g778 [Ancylostoma ceylanicum]
MFIHSEFIQFLVTYSRVFASLELLRYSLLITGAVDSHLPQNLAKHSKGDYSTSGLILEENCAYGEIIGGFVNSLTRSKQANSITQELSRGHSWRSTVFLPCGDK